MHKEMEYPQDDRTVLLDRHNDVPHRGPLTDLDDAPRLEQLESRMVHAARLRPAEAFSISLNPLVSAAANLLSEIVRLKHSQQEEDLGALNQTLANGVRQFEQHARQDSLENGDVMAARYVLCTVLDEAVVTTAWGDQSTWAQMSLLSQFHNETFGGEKFFQLLDRLTRNPVKHLAMLELMYLCLALGFEGKYRVAARGMLELEAIRDSLYRQIRHLRGDVPRELSPQWQGLQEPGRGLMRSVPAWLVAALALACLVAIYSGFAWVLDEQREAVLQPFLPGASGPLDLTP